MLENKKGQLTIFIIIAVIIIAAIIFLFWFFNRMTPITPPSAGENPQVNIEHCINSQVEKSVGKIMNNSGYVKKSNLTKNFDGKDIAYLCYTKSNYARCIVIEPVLIEHIETEIYNDIKNKIDECFINLKTDLEKEGYSVTIESGMGFSINLVPGDVETIINKKITITKADETRKFGEFKINYHTPLYDMAIIIQNIVRQESLYCNSEYTLIMRANPWIEIDKFQTGDDVKIYTLKDIKTKKEIKFAIRGCVLNTPS